MAVTRHHDQLRLEFRGSPVELLGWVPVADLEGKRQPRLRQDLGRAGEGELLQFLQVGLDGTERRRVLRPDRRDMPNVHDRERRADLARETCGPPQSFEARLGAVNAYDQSTYHYDLPDAALSWASQA